MGEDIIIRFVLTKIKSQCEIFYTTWVLLLLILPINVFASPVSFNPITPITNELPIETWKEIRDNKVIKQDLDYSCGASSLSTILTYFYNKPISEQQIIKDMRLQDVMASFQDLAEVSGRYGFIAKGIATNYDSLKTLKIPAIVYLNHKRSDHFSVIKAINDSHVVLADSSWGNRVLTRKQFESMWNTRSDENLKGSVLLILPKNEQQKENVNSSFTQIEYTQDLLKQSPELFRPIL